MQEREKSRELVPSVRSPRSLPRAGHRHSNPLACQKKHVQIQTLEILHGTLANTAETTDRWPWLSLVLLPMSHSPLLEIRRNEVPCPLSLGGHADQWLGSRSEVRLKHFIAGMRPSRCLPRPSAAFTGRPLCQLGPRGKTTQSRVPRTNIMVRKKSLLF